MNIVPTSKEKEYMEYKGDPIQFQVGFNEWMRENRENKEAFKVSVEKCMYCTGVIEVMAYSADDAEEQVQEKISIGEIHYEDISWNEPTHEPGSFQTTGDVE